MFFPRFHRSGLAGKLLLDIDIIHERDDRSNLLCPLLRAPEIPAAFLCRAECGNNRQRTHFFALPYHLRRIAVRQVEADSMISAPCACAAAACAGSVREATICMYLTVCREATKRCARGDLIGYF